MKKITTFFAGVQCAALKVLARFSSGRGTLQMRKCKINGILDLMLF